MSDEKTTSGDIVDPVVSADNADAAAPTQPTGKRRRKGASAHSTAETPAETREKDAKAHSGNATKRFFVRIGQFFKSVYEQMAKVVWPTRKELWMSVLTVFIFLIITVLVVFGVDAGAGELVRVIFQNPDGASAVPGAGMPGIPGM